MNSAMLISHPKATRSNLLRPLLQMAQLCDARRWNAPDQLPTSAMHTGAPFDSARAQAETAELLTTVLNFSAWLGPGQMAMQKKGTDQICIYV